MDILTWVLVWLLVGCGVAWMIGSAASLSNVPVDQDSSHDAVRNIVRFSLRERARSDVGTELGVSTDQGRLRRM
jgi:hypothetical protein